MQSPKETAIETVLETLSQWRMHESIGTDDVLSMVLPLFEQVADIHSEGRVGPLNGIDALSVSLGHVWFHNNDAALASTNISAVKSFVRAIPKSRLEITGHYSETLSDAGAESSNKQVASRDEEGTRVAYYPDYVAWEEKLGHHDALTDIYVLGLITASFACQLDFTEPKDLDIFVRTRDDISVLNDRIHPSVAKIIAHMTALIPNQRPQDLGTVVKALRHYREQDIDYSAQPQSVETDSDTQGIQTHLRNNLFEISRRNRLLYFRETNSTANLTLGSVPYVMDHRTIRPEQLMLANKTLCEDLGKGKAIAMSRWMRFEDYPYLSSSLNTIRLQAGRDEKEYGFSQLRIVLVFLHWHNVKDAPDERISSPLILVPVKLQKKKGVKDSFMLTADMQEAEINPVLRHHLLQLYDIQLPARINAQKMDEILSLHASIQSQIEKTAKGIDLSVVEVPRIQLIAKKAKRKLDDYRRRSRVTGKGVQSYDGLSYSYKQDKYSPLGVQIFERNVRRAEAPLREMAEVIDNKKTVHAMAQEEATIERDFYSIDKGQDKTANQWEFDLCSITLANFNYRKMTLVRDYNELISANDSDGQNFNTLFSKDAKAILEPRPSVKLASQYHVLPADPSQSESVLQGRSGQSYVIQGPPGTGKSQTITNVIVDYLAQQKSVLFVCEKRVALDVVYHRLQQVGLESLCALIHDSQNDKKAFIDDLEGIYQAWLHEDQTQTDARENTLQAVDKLLNELQSFSDDMQSTPEGSDINLRQLIQQWVALGGAKLKLSSEERARLPDWGQFSAHKIFLTELSESLSSITGCSILAKSPIWCLKGSIADADDPKTVLGEFCARIDRGLPDTLELSKALQPFLGGEKPSWGNLLEAQALVSGLLPLILDDQVALLDRDSIRALKLKKHWDALTRLSEDLDAALASADGWDLDIDPEDLNNALQAAADCEGKWWFGLSGRWRKAKNLVKTKGPAGGTSVTQSLKIAQKAQAAKQKHGDKLREIESQFGLDDFTTTGPLLAEAWNPTQENTVIVERVYSECIQRANDPDGLLKLAKNSSIESTHADLTAYVLAFQHKTPEDIAAMVAALSEQGDLAYEVADLLKQADGLSEELNVSIRTLDIPLDVIENAVLAETIDKYLRRKRSLNRFESHRIDEIFVELGEKFGQLYEANSDEVRVNRRKLFFSNIQRASGSMANTSQEEKDWRRAFNRGRKLLEREFEKTRAYKSIRELLSLETGEITRNLKPVWMMSPLSVSDVLPLDQDLFDVVIFDEASQIPLEDAVPALYRARQMIVVGDEMQLPPSAFFSGQQSDDEEQSTNLHIYNLNADSFLSRASGALPTTVLSWHYRSRHESLIGFCNQAFYGGQLQTVPSASVLTNRAPILITEETSDENQDSPFGLDDQRIQSDVYDRPISYHKLENSPYSSQRNSGEATYIAHLVRHLLLGNSDETIGIVAFSQAQQKEIESALARLASEDKAFASKLEVEEEREDEGQFVGLFVKNLENVQGDERDIIILSVCYGPNPQGKMLMNFGPINQNGGEKRLNVIFSRAKKHMVIVTSIEASQITNTYNTGANALRQYLRYAKAVSEGDKGGMQAAQVEYGYSEPQTTSEDRALISAIAERLRSEGLEVETNYGQSDMRCDLAVRRSGESEFSLGILTDNAEHYKVQSLIDRYYTPGSVLNAFGWKTCHVLAKSWYKDSDAVVTKIVQSLGNNQTGASDA